MKAKKVKKQLKQLGNEIGNNLEDARLKVKDSLTEKYSDWKDERKQLKEYEKTVRLEAKKAAIKKKYAEKGAKKTSAWEGMQVGV